MTSTVFSGFLWVVLMFGTVVRSIPKFEPGGGFIPSSGDFVVRPPRSEHQIPNSFEGQRKDSASAAQRSEDNDVATTRDGEPRFGFTSIGTTGTGYGGVSAYAPTKIDLGGVLLGAIIGVGTILVIPKLLYAFSGSYGAYARSEEGGITQSMARLDDTLARYGIDTTSCMQRAVCVYSKQAASAVRNAADDDIPDNESVSSIDRVIDAITTNQIFETAMQGTAIQEAVQSGRDGRDCGAMYTHCGLSLEALLAIFSSMMKIPAENVHHSTQTASS